MKVLLLIDVVLTQVCVPNYLTMLFPIILSKQCIVGTVIIVNYFKKD